MVKINNDSKDIIEYFEKFGFQHSIGEQPLMSYNQMTRNDNEGFIFLYLFDKLTFQNQEGTSISIVKDKIDIEYDPKGKHIVFRIGKTVTMILHINAIKGEKKK